jgi:hypothetical protein
MHVHLAATLSDDALHAWVRDGRLDAQRLLVQLLQLLVVALRRVHLDLHGIHLLSVWVHVCVCVCVRLGGRQDETEQQAAGQRASRQARGVRGVRACAQRRCCGAATDPQPPSHDRRTSSSCVPFFRSSLPSSRWHDLGVWRAQECVAQQGGASRRVAAGASAAEGASALMTAAAPNSTITTPLTCAGPSGCAACGPTPAS